MNVVCIIPARGGSKGIPRKNIKDFGGKPLIQWTIEAALSVNKIDRVVVSTEDKEISVLANEVKQAGNHSIVWNAADLPSGFYFVAMTSNDFHTTQKVTLITVSYTHLTLPTKA